MGDKELKPLQHKYDVWFRGINRGKVVPNSQNYDQNLKIVASFDTVQSFWSVYTHLDPANRDGGMWKLRLRKGLASRFWENLLLAFIGEQFMVGDDICGIVVACRFYEDYICIWNRSGHDQEIKTKINQTLKRILNLPSTIILEYKVHSEALKKCNNRSSNKTNKNMVIAT
ncbi:Eukaryotic translation initiation factor 4E type 2 [Tyrophagus putrescentiae]|nr:Eukaryotic translation initiation factor 4E type 2 [Tyrophagus putrescentiae]